MFCRKIAVITPGALPVPPIMGGSIETVVYDNATHDTTTNQYCIVSKRVQGLPAEKTDEFGVQHIYVENESWDNFEIDWQGTFLVRYNRYIYQACERLKAFGPDVIHLHNMPHWAPIIKRYFKDIPLIYTGHNDKISGQGYVQKRFKQITTAIDHFVYVSRKIAKIDILDQHPELELKTKVVYNGVDPELFKPQAPAVIAAIREKLGLQDKKVILFVGRLVKEKAPDKLLESLPFILNAEKSAVILIVGSSFFGGQTKQTPFIQKLQTLAKDHKDSVKFTGFIKNTDLPLYYSLADVFVSPVNWDDPSPKTIYEAASCATPILSTKRGGIPEIVMANESAVLLDSPYETEELAQAIIALLQDKALTDVLGNNARNRVLANFTLTHIAQCWANVYGAV